MPFSLAKVVPWGRSFDEYVRMFALDGKDLSRSILGCADGPASFNSELTTQGGRIVSCDPLYAFGKSAIEQRIDESFDTVLEQTRQNVDGFVWSDALPDVDALARVRTQAMRQFLDDVDDGKSQGRYLAAELPVLPFADDAFELAVCSHFLFLYEALGLDFHIRSAVELCRVAREVRLFPLLQLDLRPSPFVPPVIETLRSLGLSATVTAVPYEFQRGANEMLRITPV